MNDLALARTLHVLAVVIWIGGVSMVTTVLLPSIRNMGSVEDKFETFERLERRFALQARIFTTLAALSGFYMLYRMDAWDWYWHKSHWYLHAMTLVWLVFTLIVFVLEPLVLHKKLRAFAEKDPEGAFRLIQRVHWVLLIISLLALTGGVAGSHGWFWLRH